MIVIKSNKYLTIINKDNKTKTKKKFTKIPKKLNELDNELVLMALNIQLILIELIFMDKFNKLLKWKFTKENY